MTHKSPQYTPGPWHVTANGMNGNVQAVVGVADASGYSYPIAHCMQRRTGDADARLIAAAPDLLEALRKIAECAGTNAGAMQTLFNADARHKAHFGQTLGERKVIASDFMKIAAAARAALAKAVQS